MLQWIYCTCMKHGNGPINLLMDLHMYGFTYVGISFCPVPTVTDSSVPLVSEHLYLTYLLSTVRIFI